MKTMNRLFNSAYPFGCNCDGAILKKDNTSRIYWLNGGSVPAVHEWRLKAVNPSGGACGLSFGPGSRTSSDDRPCLKHIRPNISSETLDGTESCGFAKKVTPGSSSRAGPITSAAMAGISIIGEDEL